MKRRRQKSQRDPVISLINIVFLILIFFMVAGSLSSPPDPGVKFIQTNNLECCVSPDAISVDEFGHFTRSGRVITIEQLAAEHDGKTAAVRLLPDRELPAKRLLERVKQLRTRDLTNIIIITEDTSS